MDHANYFTVFAYHFFVTEIFYLTRLMNLSYTKIINSEKINTGPYGIFESLRDLSPKYFFINFSTHLNSSLA